jgi:hypothetical protein
MAALYADIALENGCEYVATLQTANLKRRSKGSLIADRGEFVAKRTGRVDAGV